MLSIGDLAHRTGVSRRMLRHWEEVRLLRPAQVDARTGHRRYELRQASRVRAIATLRAVGFGLDAIRDLLASELTEERLITLLQERELELLEQASQTAARLSEVRTRLASIEKGHHVIVETLKLVALSSLTVIGAQETVADEPEIGGAVARLLALLSAPVGAQDIALVYDGTTDASVISVTAGTLVGGHEKLPTGGHGTAHARPGELPAGGHEICPLLFLIPARLRGGSLSLGFDCGV